MLLPLAPNPNQSRSSMLYLSFVSVSVCTCIKYQFTSECVGVCVRVHFYLFALSKKKTKKNLKQFKDKNSCSSKISLSPPRSLSGQIKGAPLYFPSISRHFINFSFSSSRNSASTQARKYSEPKQSSQH